MKIQSVNNQQRCCKNPSFERVDVKFIDSSVNPLSDLFQESYDKLTIATKKTDFNPQKYMENFAQGLSSFLEKHGIEDGKIQIARTYDPKNTENMLNATYELDKKHIAGPASFAIKDLYQGQDNMNFEPLIKSLNQNYPYTIVRWFDSSNNPFRVFEPEKYIDSHKVVITHQEYASHQSIGSLETGFSERFK